MTTQLRAPYPGHKVTTLLPDPLFLDSRKSEGGMQVKRKRGGDIVTHPQTIYTYTLTLTFEITRQKSLELEAFIFSYQSATWHITLGYDGSEWAGKLIGRPVSRTAVARQSSNNPRTGGEIASATLVFSVERLN